MSGVRRAVPMVYVLQDDAVINQANPVSAILYPVLNATGYVRIISCSATVTWAVTQPNPLDVVMTVDGIPIVFEVNNPVTATPYDVAWTGQNDINFQFLDTANIDLRRRAFFVEGQNVSIAIRITWAITQPTPLFCRVKWAQLQ